MLLKENFYKRKNKKSWSLRLPPLVFLSCFVCSAQSFASFSPTPDIDVLVEAVTVDIDFLVEAVKNPKEERQRESEALMATVKNPKEERQRESEALMATVKNPKEERQREREVLMEIVENISFSPQRESDAELVKALIEKAGYISPSQMKKVTDSISENYEPSHKHKHKHEALEHFMHVDVLMKIADILSQPGWELHPNLLKVLIAKAGSHLLNKIATDVLSQPHWLGRNPEFVAALIEKGDERVLEVVAKKILSQIEWYGYPELIEALIEKGYGDKNLYVLRGTKNYQLLGWINEYILSQRHWRTHPRLIELLKGEKVTMTNMKGFWERVRERTCL